MTIIGLAIVIAFIVFSTAKLKWHPFLVLVLAAFLTAFFYGMPLPRIADTVGTGFGSILGSIGLVIVFGTIIGLDGAHRRGGGHGGVGHQGAGRALPHADHVRHRSHRLHPGVL